MPIFIEKTDGYDKLQEVPIEKTGGFDYMSRIYIETGTGKDDYVLVFQRGQYIAIGTDRAFYRMTIGASSITFKKLTTVYGPDSSSGFISGWVPGSIMPLTASTFVLTYGGTSTSGALYQGTVSGDTVTVNRYGTGSFFPILSRVKAAFKYKEDTYWILNTTSTVRRVTYDHDTRISTTTLTATGGNPTDSRYETVSAAVMGDDIWVGVRSQIGSSQGLYRLRISGDTATWTQITTSLPSSGFAFGVDATIVSGSYLYLLGSTGVARINNPATAPYNTFSWGEAFGTAPVAMTGASFLE